MVLAMFMATIFGSYAYAFFLGSIWIEKDIYNSIYGRTYTSGDVLSIFFGIVFGLFAIGTAAPNIQAVAEGKAAGKMAFDIIDR